MLFLTHVYDTKMYLKKLFDKRFRRIFSSAFQWRKQFFQNFSFSPSKSTKKLYLKKCIFNIFFYPLDLKLSIFYVGKDIFQRVPQTFFARNRMRKNFEDENGKFRKNYLHHWKAEKKTRRKRLSNNCFKYFLVS